MSFQDRRSYDEEEYEGAQPEIDGVDADEWADEGEVAAAPSPPRRSKRPAAPEVYAADEAEPEPVAAPAAKRSTAAPRPAPAPQPAAPPRAPARRPAPPPPRPMRGSARPSGRSARYAPPRQEPAYAAGLPRWAMPAGLAAIAVLGLVAAFLFLGNAGQRPQLSGDAMSTASARNTELAPLVQNVDGFTTDGPEGVAATVNGKPIPMNEFLDRLQAAKQDYGDQFQLDFGGEVGKRMAHVLGFDVLDQMVNFEVLLQQAQKENIVPNPTQVQQRYDDIRTSTAQQKLSWETFLSQQHMSDVEFRQNIVDAFTYLVIANNHGSQGADENAKAKALADYICGTRKQYDVKVYVHFIVPQEACSSAYQMPGEPPANLTVTVPASQPSPVETGEPPAVQSPAPAGTP